MAMPIECPVYTDIFSKHVEDQLDLELRLTSDMETICFAIGDKFKLYVSDKQLEDIGKAISKFRKGGSQ